MLAATEATSQELHLARLLGEIAALDERMRSLGRSLDAEQLAWRPPDGGWSIGQVLEHLVVSNESYIAPIRAMVRRGGAAQGSAATRWRPSFFGGLLIRSLLPTSTRRLPAPRSYQPGVDPRPNVLEALLRTQRELADLLQESAALDWRRVRGHSPVSSLIRLNLGDFFTVLVVHTQRHLLQIERVQAREGFPRAAPERSLRQE